MPTLDILILAAADVQSEKRDALHVIAELNRSAAPLELVATLEATPASPPDLAVVIVWSDADAALVAALDAAVAAPRRWLFRRTAPVEVDLTDRPAVLAKLERKEALDTLLEERAAGWRQIGFDTPAAFTAALERELRTLQGGARDLAADALGLRPTGQGYLARPRLLERFPDAARHVVWLETPYGYGKSVLAAQWAERLERDEWRVLWVAGDPRMLVARALGISGDAPDAFVLERLWEVPTLLVVEDLEGDEELDWLLEDVQGLVLLASRDPLPGERLQALLAAGGATRFGAEDLAFTRAEAGELVGDEATAAELHAATLGWSLPLHFASLTGGAPDAPSLLAGIRASLDAATWREVLLLAALPYLPQEAATESTTTLVAKGFVQRLETSYRLHPYVQEIVFDAHRSDVVEAVRRERDRLPLLLQGEAFERCRDYERLVEVLEAAEAELWRRDPGRLVAWDALVRGLASPRRDWTVGAALGRLQDYPGAIERLTRALDADGLDADAQLGIMRELCVPFALLDGERGLELIRRAESLLERAAPEPAGRFLGNAALVHAHAERYEQAIESARRALDHLPADSPHRLASEINEALFRYDLYGDFDFRLRTQIDLLERTEAVYSVQAYGQCRDIGMMTWWLGDLDSAVAYLERARDGERINPLIGLEARAALAYLDGDDDALGDVLRSVRRFDNRYLSDVTSMYAVAQALERGDPERARRIYEDSPRAAFGSSAYARVLIDEGRSDEALELLDAFGDVGDRNTRLYLDAARYLVARSEADLQAFLGNTTAGARLLPGFIPLEALPERPELAAHYPIGEVLASGWKEAVRLRRDDIPPLELTLLGDVTATLLGEPLQLTDRQMQLLLLLTLGRSRDEVAEAMWPEVDAKKQRNNLNVQLNALRKAIEPWGVPTYLHEGGVERVASDRERLLAALDADDAATVYALYREPFAPGVDLAPVEDERARLRDAVTELLYEASAQADDAVSYLDRVLELEPLHESALQALLKALLRRGRRLEARRRYAAFAATLHSELELEPLDATRAILQA